MGEVHFTRKEITEAIDRYQEKHPLPYSIDVTTLPTKDDADIISATIERIVAQVNKDTEMYIICEMAKAYMAGIVPRYERKHESKILYEATIPLNPKTKKNRQKIIKNRRTGSLMVVQSDDYVQYEKDAGRFLKRPAKPISEPVNVKCVFYRDSERRCDLTNLLEAIDDILVKYGILADDNFKVIRTHDGSTVLIDRDNPRTEITIEPKTDKTQDSTL